MEQKNISADDYILFAAIVEQESLVRAVEHLGMPKATVSRRFEFESKIRSALFSSDS